MKYLLPVGLLALVARLATAEAQADGVPVQCTPAPPGPCECTDGPCCDGCHFLGPEALCAGGVEELGCLPADGACGGEVVVRRAERYCSGASAACDGALAPAGPWESLGRCGGEQVCLPARPGCRAAAECLCLVRCSDDDPCTVDSCDDAGGCRHEPVVCDDGVACTPDRCDGGVCLHGPPDCNDGNECTMDVCEGVRGCQHGSREGVPCLVAGGLRGVCLDSACCVPDCEGRECGSDGCGGTCGDCDDADDCTQEACRADGTCERWPTCDDGVACTWDTCLSGYCIYTPDDAACDDGIACTADSCGALGCFHESACSCADDGAEDDDSRATARVMPVDVLQTGLRAVYGDEDWAWLDVPAGSELRVELWTDGSGDVAADFELTVVWDCGERLGVTAEGDALVASGRATFAGPAFIGVRARVAAGRCLDYDLVAHVTPVELPTVTCNVRCPYLDGYEVTCNAQNHCEYARPSPEGWQVADVLIWVPPGSFPFGRGEGIPVTFWQGYWVDKYEVTAGAYAAFLDERGSNLCAVEWHQMDVACLGYCSNNEWGQAPHRPDRSGAWQCRVAWDDELREAWIPALCQRETHGPLTTCRDHPVGDVTWFGAREFCHWRGAELCSEAQWERAGKGNEQREYPWGDAPVPGGPGWDPEIACVQRNPGYEVSLELAMSRGASPVGCHHLAGNVEEWVLDTGPADLSPEVPHDFPLDGSPWLAGERDVRVVRGRRTESEPFLGREPMRAWFRVGTERPIFDVTAFATSEPGVGFRCCRARKCAMEGGER